MTKVDLERIKLDALSDDADLSIDSFEKLGQLGGDEVIDFLIPFLKSENVRVRNSSAIALGEIRDNKAVDPLIEAIRHPIDKDNTGSLVHALSKLDCGDCFLLLIDVALHYSYESQSHALNILESQRFNVSKEDINLARGRIDDYLNSDDKCDDYETLIVELNECVNAIEKTI